MRHKIFKNIFSLGGHIVSGKTGFIYTIQLYRSLSDEPLRSSGEVFCVFTAKTGGHAVSGSNGILSSIIKAQSDGKPVG